MKPIFYILYRLFRENQMKMICIHYRTAETACLNIDLHEYSKQN
jgi:hypothetical protein